MLICHSNKEILSLSLGGVSLHLASSPNEFSWYLIFVDGNFIPHVVIWFVLEIRWWLRITNVDYCRVVIWVLTQFFCRSVTMEKSSSKLHYKKSFKGLAMCNETSPRTWNCQSTPLLYLYLETLFSPEIHTYNYKQNMTLYILYCNLYICFDTKK